MLWLRVLIIFVVFVLSLMGPCWAGLVDIRAGSYQRFERLVVELSQRVEFRIERRERALVLIIDDTPGNYQKRLPEGAFFRVDAIRAGAGKTTITIGLKEDVEIREGHREEPFRIVIDLIKKRGVKKTMNRENMSEPSEKTSTEPLSVDTIELLPSDLKVTTGKDRGVEFNDGWRWIYRKEIHRRLALLEDMTVELRGLAEGVDEEELKTLKTAIQKFHGGGEELTLLWKKYRGTPVASLVRFVQGYIYERKGFYPEATAHYRMAVDDAGSANRALLREALFREGLVMFLQARFADSAGPLKRAYAMGHKRAGAYLANVFLIRGEAGRAWKVFSGLGHTGHSLAIMGVADMSMGAGRYRHARLLYRRLFNRYTDRAELSAFFTLRMADTYMLEADTTQAMRLYTRIKDEFKDDARVMGIMGLAELLAKRGDKKSLTQAEGLYRAVISHDYMATEYAYTAIAEIEAKLGKYQRAVLYLQEMTQRYPTGEFRYRAYNLRGYIVHRWIESLSEKKDYHTIARIYRVYEKEIPFGLKAQTYLSAGRAFVKLSLYRDAIDALKNAVKMGKQDISQDALVLVGFSYMKLDELSKAQRVIEGFLKSYPESRLRDRALRVLAMVYYSKGEYEKLASMNTEDPDILFLKASSLYALKRYTDAERILNQLVVVFSQTKGREEKLAHIYIILGDVAFMSSDYRTGIEHYVRAKRLSRWLSKEDIAWIDLRLAEGYRRLGHHEAIQPLIEELKDTEDNILEEFVDLLLDEGVEKWKETLH